MQDSGFIVDVEKGNDEVRPATGAETERIVHQLVETPEDVRAKVKAAFAEHP
jgi:hypothetical protein